MVKLRSKDLVSVEQLSLDEVNSIFELTKELKANRNPREDLKGKTLGMIFEKPSTRTRVSFDVAMSELGGNAIYLSSQELQLSRGETIADTARVLSRYCHALVARTYSHKSVEILAKYASIPIINGLTDLLHPCQALTDFFTIQEKKGTFDIKLAYVGDGCNNVLHSLLLLASKFPIHFTVGCPKKYSPEPEILRKAKTGQAEIVIIPDPYKAVSDADVIYTDVWVSMGQEKEKNLKLAALKDYQVNSKLVSYAKDDVIIMHCLPAHRNEEITDEVLDSKKSIVFDQAENRLHVQKALLLSLLTG